MTPIHIIESIVISNYVSPLAERKDVAHVEQNFKKVYKEKKEEVQQVSHSARLAKDLPKENFEFSKMPQEDQQENNHLAMMHEARLRAHILLKET